MKPRPSILSLMVIVFAAGVAYGDKITVDWDHQANFGHYKTYAWLDSKNPAEDQLMAKRIMQAVDSQLSAKGLQRVDAGQDPDLSVAYDSGVHQRVSWVPYPWGPPYAWGGAAGPGWGWDWGPACCYWEAPYTAYPLVEDIGTLAVNIVDEHEKQLVWRGVGSDELKDNPEKNARKICELVAKMFRKYPPPPGAYRRKYSRLTPEEPIRQNDPDGLRTGTAVKAPLVLQLKPVGICRISLI